MKIRCFLSWCHPDLLSGLSPRIPIVACRKGGGVEVFLSARRGRLHRALPVDHLRQRLVVVLRTGRFLVSLDGAAWFAMKSCGFIFVGGRELVDCR